MTNIHEAVVGKDWYHGSFERIDEFRSFTHFGTLEAAKKRLSDKRAEKKLEGDIAQEIYKCSLKVCEGEVLFVSKDWGSNRAQSLANVLKDCFPEVQEYTQLWERIKNVQTTYSEHPARKRVANEYGYPALKELLLDQGYKAVIYPNAVEDKGHYSLVVIDPEIIEDSHRGPG